MLSNSHSIEYAFDDLYIDVGGVRVNIYVSGSAELENDPGYGFFVRSITLNGDVPDQMPGAHVVSRFARKPAKVTLEANNLNAHTREPDLFAVLCDALYEDRGAKEAWQAEVEGEAA